eukprot:1185033-Prorocentrum_minimum.AAC.1
MFIEPLLKWLRKGEQQFATSEATVGPLAYADDLAVVTNTVSQMHTQAKRIETFCKWAGLHTCASEHRWEEKEQDCVDRDSAR